MRRKSFIVVALVCLAAGLVVIPFLTAQQRTDPGLKTGVTQPSTPKTNSEALPISRVILYTSGVGYLQREGQVEGDAHLNLSFPVQEINDLLMSLVLRDLNGGKIRTVTYDSRDPIEKTLKSFAINLSGNPTFAEILNQTRGEKVTILWQPPKGQQTPVSGANLGVEKKKQGVGKDTVTEVEYVNVWSDKGLQSIKLTEVTLIQLQNPTVKNELNRALAVVAQSHDTQEKVVSLFFSGKGKRTVQVGYVVEHPVWKTSYRLVLGKEAKPFLQGWAMVENPSNEDWNGVNLSLVSGRPVSFRMDLYQPFYVDRPLVQLPMFQNLRPITYEGDMDSFRRLGKAEAKKDAREMLADRARGAAPPNVAGAPAPGGGGFAGALQQTTPTMAQGVTHGDQFQYVISEPVSVARQKSALVPIINANVEGTRVSIFNEKNLAKFPMLGLKFKNTTPLHLMQGPITVFAEDSFAGDALIGDMQPNEERLLSYAVDLATEVKTESKLQPDAVVKFAITKGIVHKTIILRDTNTYIAKNRSDHAKTLLIEQPIRAPEFVLVSPPKAPSQSQTFYRFEMNVPAGETKSFPVVEERKVVEEIILTNANDQTLVFLQRNAGASQAMKTALQEAIELKLKQAKTLADISQLEAKIKVIATDQARQRDNMKVIPQTDPVYKKYLDKFLKQEEQIDQLRAQIEQLQVTANQQRQVYEDYVLSITTKEE